MNAQILIIIALVIALIGVIISFISLYRDKKAFEDLKDIRENGKIIGTFHDFDGIDTIIAENLELFLVMDKGPNHINVYGKTDDIKLDDYFLIKDEGNVLRITSLKNASRFTSDWLRLEISIANLEDISVKLGDFKGVLDINTDLKSLEINNLTGFLSSNTANTYDIDIDNVDGLVDLNFTDKDAIINLSRVLGTTDVLGEKIVDRLEGKAYTAKFASGKNTINIKNINGSIDID